MDIDNLTLGELKKINSLFTNGENKEGLQYFVGRKVIVRTYSAGVHFGEIIEKAGSEVILKQSRRLFRWKPKTGVSLTEVANHGLLGECSKVCEPVTSIWLNAIEIIDCSKQSILNIEGQDVFTP